MENQTTEKKTDGILALAVLTVPAIDYAQQPRPVRTWITEQTRNGCAEAPEHNRDAFAAQHPLLGAVACIAMGFLERREDDVRIADVVLACGDEVEALQAVNRVLARHTGPVVMHDDGPPSMRHLLGRMLVTGTAMQFDASRFPRELIDLAMVLSPSRARNGLPLHVVMSAIGRRDEHEPMNLAALTSAYRTGRRAILGDEVLLRLERTAALYVHLYGGRKLTVIPVPFDGSVLES